MQTNQLKSQLKNQATGELTKSRPSRLLNKRSVTEILSAEAAYQVMRHRISQDIEEFWVLALGPAKALLSSQMIFRGTVDSCLVHPRDIFRFACLNNASSLIVVHNHPSGDSRPSEQDLLFTQKLIRISRMMEIPVIDHLILTSHDFTSFASEGWCNFGDEY